MKMKMILLKQNAEYISNAEVFSECVWNVDCNQWDGWVCAER